MLPSRARLLPVHTPLAVLAAMLAMFDAACNSDSSLNSGGPCAELAQATCTLMQKCEPNSIQVVYGGEAACESRVNAECQISLAAPMTGATVARKEACAQAFATYSCSDYLNKTNIPAACAQVTGAVPSGGACAFAGQCQSGFCAIVPGSACGKCAAPPVRGDSCAQLTSCGQSLICTSDTLVCTTYVAKGNACGMGQPCAPGLSCVAPGGVGTAGVCQIAGATVGTKCDGYSKTAPGCDFRLGFYCNGMSKCAQTTYAAGGQSCGYDSTTGIYVGCASGSCTASSGETGTCVARAPDNGACTVPDGGANTPNAGCIPPARCIGSACQTPTGTSCQ